MTSSQIISFADLPKYILNCSFQTESSGSKGATLYLSDCRGVLVSNEMTLEQLEVGLKRAMIDFAAFIGTYYDPDQVPLSYPLYGYSGGVHNQGGDFLCAEVKFRTFSELFVLGDYYRVNDFVYNFMMNSDVKYGDWTYQSMDPSETVFWDMSTIELPASYTIQMDLSAIMTSDGFQSPHFHSQLMSHVLEKTADVYEMTADLLTKEQIIEETNESLIATQQMVDQQIAIVEANIDRAKAIIDFRRRR